MRLFIACTSVGRPSLVLCRIQSRFMRVFKMHFAHLGLSTVLVVTLSCLTVEAEESLLSGAWAALDKNSPGLEVEACAAVAKFGLARLSGNTVGEVVAFTSKKRL